MNVGDHDRIALPERPQSMAAWLRTGRGRLQFMGFVFAACFAVIGARLVDLMLLNETGEPLLNRAQTQSPSVIFMADVV